MKQTLLITSFLLILISACQKSVETTDINGSWQLTEVLDKTTGTIARPPAASNMSIVLTFLNGNSFAGHTFRNSISDGTYERNQDDISFKGFAMTKIAEDALGQSFLSVLDACLLQSASPCVPSKISIQGNTMTITTAARYDVTLRKM